MLFVFLADYLCSVVWCFFFFKQKTAYEMRISDWSSDVCSSDLKILAGPPRSGDRNGGWHPSAVFRLPVPRACQCRRGPFGNLSRHADLPDIPAPHSGDRQSVV